MPKKVEPIIINETDANKLRSIADGSTPSGESVTKRALALILMSEGMPLKAVAAEVSMRENSITDIRRRFLTEGIGCLYDKPKSGRPISYDPVELENMIDIRLLQCTTENIPIPSVKALAEELKAPQQVVREILQKKNVVPERGPRYWRFTLSDGTVPKLADMIGLYLSPSEQAIVLKVWTPAKSMTIDLGSISDSVEIVGTKTKEIAARLEAIFDASGKIDMADALTAFSDSGKAIRLGKKDSAISFLKDILPEGLDAKGIEYHVFTCGVSLPENKRAILPDTCLHVFSSREEWMSQLEIIVTSMYSGDLAYDKAAKVRNSIYSYLRTAKSTSEPFQWTKIVKETDETERPAATREPVQERLSDSKPGTLRFTAEFVDDNQNIITVRVHADIPITQEAFETESRQGYLNSYDKVEKAIITASREASRLLSERYLEEIGKKKR